MRLRWKIVVTLLLVLLIPLGLVSAGAALPKYYEDSYYAELSDMYTHLKTTEKHKIVVVGGSSVAFGLDTHQLETYLSNYGYDYEVCSFGLYGAVGLTAMLDLSVGELSEGDIVIFAFEPQNEVLTSYFGAGAYLKCADTDLSLLGPLSGDKKSAVLGNFLSFIQEKRSIQKSGILPNVDGVYARSSFDETGNMTYVREGSTMSLGYDPTELVDFETLEISESLAEEVNEYISKAEKAGAVCYTSFCPVNRLCVTEENPRTLYTYYRLFADTFNCEVISDPSDYLLDAGWFYDSNFHLNSAGATVRTQQLASDLLSALDCYETLAFESVTMPESVATTVQDDGTTDTSYFIFEEVGGQDGGPGPGQGARSCMVTGLTETGLQQESLTVPAYYEGSQVITITADAFSGADLLTAVTLPATILYLPDDAFTGCSRMERLTLLHEDFVPTVTDKTFRRVPNLKIYVTRTAYPYYRDGQGCEDNPWLNYLDRIYIYN